MPTQKKVIFAALNWGIGHATRSIPLITYALEKDCEVMLLSDGDALELWRREFPDLPTKQLPSYGVKYRLDNIYLNILIRTPGLLGAMLSEYYFLKNVLKEFPADLIISDNRYGIYSPTTPSVIIGHQLNLPVRPFWLARLVSFLHNQLLRKFNAIWVPDYKEYPSLSGDLSHPPPIESTYYIGPLSRFKSIPRQCDLDILAVLSGPEPQRSKLEKKLISQLSKLPNKCMIVSGLPRKKDRIKHIGTNLEIHSFLCARELNEQMSRARMVIARTGYSTIMDLAVVKVPALLIPTPGQAEQEYLAKELSSNIFFVVQDQHKLDVEEAWSEITTNEKEKNLDFAGTFVSYRQLMDALLNH